MAVWRSPVIRNTIFRELYEVSPRILEVAAGPNPHVLLGKSDGRNGGSYDWHDTAANLGWREPNEDEDVFSAFMDLIKGVKRFRFNQEAVFFVCKSVHEGSLSPVEQVPHEKVRETVQEIVRLIAPATQVKEDEFVSSMSHVVDSISDAGKRYRDAAAALTHTVVRDRAGNAPFEANDLRVGKQTFVRGHKATTAVYRLGQCLAFRNFGQGDQAIAFLSRPQVDNVVGALLRLANTEEYIRARYSTRPTDAKLLRTSLDRTLQCAFKARGDNARYVGRALHKIRAHCETLLCESVLEDIAAAERKDFTREGLDAIAPINLFADVIHASTRLVAHDCLNLYKWIPPPDYDPFECVEAHRANNLAPRACALDAGASKESKAAWDAIVLERNINFAATYRRIHGANPPGLAPEGRDPRRADYLAWEPRKCLNYREVRKDISSMIKDKTIAPEVRDRALRGEGSFEETSYLGWFMSNNGQVDVSEELTRLSKGELDSQNHLKLAFKAESHKVKARMFAIAPPRLRLVLAEHEGNLARIASNYPGSLLGLTPGMREKQLANVMNVYERPPGVDAWEDSTTFVVTFDLSKFSDRDPRAVTEEYHKFWARIYGKPELASLVRIGPDSLIYSTREGVRMHYKNAGADIQGFRGRMKTMQHSDMLGAACRLARERGLILGRGVLAVYIDDGAVKVAVPGYDEEAKVALRGFVDVMREVYAAGGQEVNVAKVVASAHSGNMLGDYFYQGYKVPVGIKAYQRVHPAYDTPVVALTEDTATIFSAAQGAAKAGTPWALSYGSYVVNCVRVVARWARREFRTLDPKRLALGMLTPKSFGGFGLSGTQGLLGTAVVNETCEAIGHLNRAARMYPDLRARIYAILRRPVVRRDALSRLRDPVRIRAETPVLVESRLVAVVTDNLQQRETRFSGFFSAARVGEAVEHARLIADKVFSAESMDAAAIQGIWRACPLSYIESVVGKFKRADSIVKLLGWKRIGVIRRANLRDVRSVLAALI
jgi:hypothetical protein